MKRILFFNSLLLFSSLISYGQQKDEQSIRQLMDQITTSMRNHDINSLDHIYASDFVFVNANGKKFTRSERLSNLRSLPAPEEFAFQNEKIRIYGNTAIVNGEVRIKQKGQSLQTHYITLVFIKGNNLWKEVSAQGTLKGS